jgi:hypothetical protein
MSEDIKEFLLSNFEEQEWDGGSPCWIWTGPCLNEGYGYLKYEGRTQLVHRVSHKVFKGPIPSGALITHDCDRANCYRPDHLRIGSYQSNVDEMRARGRGRPPYGNLNRCVLLEKEVIEMREMAANGVPTLLIAEHFRVSRPTALSAITGQTYRNVGGPLTIIQKRRKSASLKDHEVLEIRRMAAEATAVRSSANSLVSLTQFYQRLFVVIGTGMSAVRERLPTTRPLSTSSNPIRPNPYDAFEEDE